jgi:hypothetical protein
MDDPNEQNNTPYNLPSQQNQLTESDVRSIIADVMANFTMPAKIAGGFLQSSNFLSGVKGWQLRPDGAEINGGVAVTSLNIPDTTTANSFHTDSSGNSWWGGNLAGGYAGGKAYILNTGAAVFTNIKIGGNAIQYTIGNSGIFSFGDGSDGAAAFDGSNAVVGYTLAGSIYTATRDVYFTDATISTGVEVKPNGYRIFGTGTLTLNGTGKITGNGNDGSNGLDAGTGTGGAGGAALADGYLKGSVAGAKGGDGHGTGGDSSTGTNTTNSIGSSGAVGGVGGTAGFAGGSSTAGVATASNVKLIANWHLATLLDISSTGSTVKFDNSAGSAGGGGGGGNGGGNAAGGGGAGSAGRIIAIYFRNIVIGASASITANGGKGGNGGNVTLLTFLGSGGGGGGGNGGEIILVYNTYSNSGTVTANGGAKGTAGTGTYPGGDGNPGTAGHLRLFQLSL